MPTRASAWCTFPADDGHRERVAGWDVPSLCLSVLVAASFSVGLVLSVLRVRSPTFQV